MCAKEGTLKFAQQEKHLFPRAENCTNIIWFNETYKHKNCIELPSNKFVQDLLMLWGSFAVCTQSYKHSHMVHCSKWTWLCYSEAPEGHLNTLAANNRPDNNPMIRL